MKLTAIAVSLAFVAAPALAQQYPGASNSPSANSSATDQATPGMSSNDDTRVASNQAKHRKHRSSSSSSSHGQMDSSSQATPSQDTQAPATPAPAPQQ